MQLIANKRLAIDSRRENRFPLDAFWEMGIYLGVKTTGFVECVQIQFSHRWVNWESIWGVGNLFARQWETAREQACLQSRGGGDTVAWPVEASCWQSGTCPGGERPQRCR
ncbi:hypothetical protein Pan181_49020 [Aeoliella mucimassa]|uniref:Uncharacterized protein n=1 Tax=Aeoliella mucimassa TaxID=2527972 RepID=A0A518AVC5_9BACT|nr:hypothetical protein Pan181_49020 [Aeoliella mucimassa]